MTLISKFAEHWFGLCRKPPAIYALQPRFGFPQEPACEGCPEGGGSGGSGTIRRGTGAALSGLKILIHNPQLLWFSLFLGLVLAGLSIILGALRAVSSSPGWQFFVDSPVSQWRFFVDPFITRGWPDFYPDNARLLYSLVGTFVLTFVVELSMVICLVFLLAGLVLSLSSKKGDPVSFVHGLARAKKYSKPLSGWAVAVTLAGTLLFMAGQYSSLLNLTTPSGFLFYALTQNPFNYVLNPNLEAAIFPWGESGIIYSGLIDTLILSAVNLFLFTLTLFVVPLLVLERKSLKEAVSGSFTLMRKIWGEVAACVLGLGIVVFAATLTSLLFQVAAGGNIAVNSWPPAGEWLAAGILYVLVLSSLACIAATVGGIAVLDLYTSAKIRASARIH